MNQQLQRRTAAQQDLQAATPVSGKLTRLPTHGSISTNDPNQATQWIEEAYEISGLVLAPFGNSVPFMPPGYGISVTPVGITDFNDGFDGTEIYPIKGSKTKKGLLKGVLDSCATGMGFDWPPQWTWVEKFNDERDNDRLCQKITVCGRYKDVDGTWKTLPPQTKEIDLREGSSEVEEIRARHLAKQLYDLPRDATPQARTERERLAKQKADAELAQTRKFIRSHAQTKARLMVIGTRMRRSYTLEELRKGPFFCFRVIKTYRAPADRPDLQAKIDDAAVKQLMESSEALYGTPPTQVPALPPASDEPYPEPQDAGVVAETAAAQSEEPEVKTCSPEGCLGHGSNHVQACSLPVNQKAKTQTAEPDNAWVIPGRGPARGLRINDPKVTPETLFALRKEYAEAINPEGDLRSKLNDDAVDFYSSALREVQKEIERRGITDTETKKY